MKKFFWVITLLFLSTTITAQKTKFKTTHHKRAKVDKYHDNIDDRMKGPNGEVIYIGINGGRYYIKKGRKVYVEYKGNKKK